VVLGIGSRMELQFMRWESMMEWIKKTDNSDIDPHGY